MHSISIIIPVYNVADYLSRCIDSVLSQREVQIEVLLIDDGSTDSSGSVCDEYVRKDNRVRVFHQENGGVSSARNKGIENAINKWICFVDADDWLEPNSLSSILTDNCSQDTDMLIARSYINRGGKAIDERYPFNLEEKGKRYKGTELVIDKSYIRGSVWGVLYNRLFLLNHNILFPISLKNGEDSIFFSLCIIYAENVMFVDTYLYNIYERLGSASRSWSFEKVLKMVDNISYINHYIDSNPEFPIEVVNVLNYSKYRVISNIYYNFHQVFSFRGYFILRREIKGVLNKKIDTGEIRISKDKIRMLNLSLDLFAFLVLIKK